MMRRRADSSTHGARDRGVSPGRSIAIDVGRPAVCSPRCRTARVVVFRSHGADATGGYAAERTIPFRSPVYAGRSEPCSRRRGVRPGRLAAETNSTTVETEHLRRRRRRPRRSESTAVAALTPRTYESRRPVRVVRREFQGLLQHAPAPVRRVTRDPVENL